MDYRSLGISLLPKRTGWATVRRRPSSAAGGGAGIREPASPSPRTTKPVPWTTSTEVHVPCSDSK